MDYFKDPEIIELSALLVAFVIGVAVCIYVAIKETAELNRRRRAKKVMYNQTVQREVRRKQQLRRNAQASNNKFFA